MNKEKWTLSNIPEAFKANYNRLDVLLNNAGIMISPYFLIKDGFEGQMGTNHLGHFALSGHLIGLILKTSGSRVVNVSSVSHRSGQMDFDNLLFEKGKEYTPMKASGRFKLSNLLFTYELQRYFESRGSDSIPVAANPGVSRTNLARYVRNKFWFKLLTPFLYVITQNAAMGALPQIRASVDPRVQGGEYYGSKDAFGEMKGYPQIVESNELSHNMEDAARLWEISEKFTGVKF